MDLITGIKLVKTQEDEIAQWENQMHCMQKPDSIPGTTWSTEHLQQQPSSTKLVVVTEQTTLCGQLRHRNKQTKNYTIKYTLKLHRLYC